MITLCQAAKGGSGTTVVACTRAITSPGPALLVDLDGDVPRMLGIDDPGRPGAVDWLASDAPTAHLDDLLVTVTPNCTLLPAHGSGIRATSLDRRRERWDDLFAWLSEWSGDTGGSAVIDAGTIPVPTSLLEQCQSRWLVTRACYLALRRAAALPVRPTGVVLVEEPGRALRRRHVQDAIGAPVIATVAWDIRVARAVDAGLLVAGRLPRALQRAIGSVTA